VDVALNVNRCLRFVEVTRRLLRNHAAFYIRRQFIARGVVHMLRAISACTLSLVFAVSATVAAKAEESGEPPQPIPAYASPYDPLSPVNEKLLTVNVFFDDHVARPVATAWSWILPYRARIHIQDFFRNTGEPRNAVNCLMQRDFHEARVSVERFSLNTTLGVAGFFDVADGWFGLKRHPNDFGLTAAHYSVGFGPYLMAPASGPTSFRDAASGAADGPLNALSTIGWLVPSLIAMPIGVGLGLIDAINERSLSLETFEDANRYAVDLYGAVQDSYYQKRVSGQPSSSRSE
jgi:phospholipid-binding lipoprotein MlaA